MPEPTPEPTLTVAGVTFTAAQVVSAVLKIDGREIRIAPERPAAPERAKPGRFLPASARGSAPGVAVPVPAGGRSN